MATYHISEAEAARDFSAIMARVREGAEVVIEKESAAPILIRALSDRPVRRLSESLRIAEDRSSGVTLDGGFEADLEAVINSHREPIDCPWE
jgi:antitoxin (DNA-binding transcriptional repressor) of toxin-antitoxin stability system